MTDNVLDDKTINTVVGPTDNSIIPRIRISSRVTVQNPLIKSNLSCYQGPITADFDFRKQTENFQALQASLAPFQIQINYIWFAQHAPAPGWRKQGRYYHFVAKDERDIVFWQKYESDAQGSGQNRLYVFGHQMKLSDWLHWSQEKRIDFIKSLDPDNQSGIHYPEVQI